MIEPRFCPACGAAMARREIDHRLRSICTNCGQVAYRNPAPAAGCLVERDDAVLMVRRKLEPYRGLWHFPSGFVEYGEDVRETARREVREETGLEVELGPVFGAYSAFDDPRQETIIILYRSGVIGGELQAGDDAAEVAFFSRHTLPTGEQIAFETHRRMLAEWRDERD